MGNAFCIITDGRSPACACGAASRYAGRIVGLWVLVAILAGCTTARPTFQPIDGFDAQTNERFAALFETASAHEGRKVAVFDCDGTLLGQVPHYLMDEAFWTYVQRHPDRKPELVKQLRKMRDAGQIDAYLQGVLDYFAGMPADELAQWGASIYRTQYPGKLYPKMAALVEAFKHQGFEVWVITGSTQVLYRDFLHMELGIPRSRIFGTRSLTRQARITDVWVPPVTLEEGKAEVIQTFIQTTPLFVAGNSRGDFEMLQLSRGLALLVNPDDTRRLAAYGGDTLAGYARQHNWLVVHCRDVPEPGAPNVASGYGVPENTAHP